MAATENRRLLVYGGLLMTLLAFSVPYEGLIGLPVVFFLKNKLGLTAHDVAAFNLIATIPLFAGFVFGFLRDVWSPFGRGDRAHILIFGLAAAAAYGVLALSQPTYPILLAGVLITTVMIQMVWAAGRGATSAMGVIGGIGQAAYTDLAIRACPPGLQGTMMMMFARMYYVSLRIGDLFGA